MTGAVGVSVIANKLVKVKVELSGFSVIISQQWDSLVWN